MDNVAGAVDVPLSLFGGLNTEVAPSDLPEGVSPDNQDVVFLPGSVSQRPGRRRLLGSSLAGKPFFADTYLQPNGNPLTMFAAAGGGLYKEDVNVSPGTYSQIGNLSATAGSPGSTSQGVAVNAFGRMYMAFSDGLHGSEVPLQFDGTNLDRVSQDGPGAAVTASDSVSQFTVTATPNGILPYATPAIVAASQSGNLVTLTATIPSQLRVGDSIIVAGVGVAGYNGTFPVLAIGTNSLQYNTTVTGLAPSAGGTIQTPLFQVVTTAANGFSAGSLVKIAGATAYNGTFTVRSVDSATTFTISTATVFGGAGGNGTATAAGLITAGVHQVVVMFLTRQGYITAPSPPFSWTSAGGVSAIISNIPVGPPNVIARILAFTGAGGGSFFYIPATVTVGGQTVQSTIINDNTSFSATISFSDDALFAATAIDIPGNNLFALQVLPPSLGVFLYASRLFWWGFRKQITNLLNMGFDGGNQGANTPAGWLTTGGRVQLNTNALSGWAVTLAPFLGVSASIYQPAYQDYTGTAILQPKTQYSFRFYCVATSSGVDAPTLTVDLFSPSQGQLALKTFNNIQVGWNEGAFSAATPAVIPSDLRLRITASGTNLSSVEIDECSVIYTNQPYVDTQFIASYVNNPESFDGVTGYIGPTSDATPIRAAFNQRNNMYIVTGDGMHQTQDNPTTEPSGWAVNELNQATGGVSARCVAGGEDWQLIVTPSGLRIFEGSEPFKISQEIQTLFDSIDDSQQSKIWIQNDPATRRAYIGTPNNQMLVLDYRELDTANQISGSGSLRVSFTGKMIGSELGRKWTVWNLAATSGALLARPGDTTQFCFTGTGTSGGNIYNLDSSLLYDDDSGRFFPYYVTYFFVNHDSEQGLGLGSHRKLYRYLSAFIKGTGLVTFETLADSLANVFESTPDYQMSQTPTYDLEWGLNTLAERAAIKIIPKPIADLQNRSYTNGIDTSFTLNKLVVTMMQDPWSPIRGAI